MKSPGWSVPEDEYRDYRKCNERVIISVRIYKSQPLYYVKIHNIMADLYY